MAKPPSQGGRQGSLWGGVLSIPDWQLSMNMRRGLVLLMLVVLPTFYNFQQAWERTAKDTWLDSGPAPENFEVEPEVLSLPPTLKRIKLIRRERKQTEASIRSTQLDAHLRPHTSADSSDEVSTELSGEVSRTGGRTAAAGIAAWPWFSFWTPNGNGSQGSGLPAGNGRDGASGSDSDVITRENDAMQEGGGKEIGGRKIGGSSRQAIASVIWKVEEALSSGGGTSHEEGSAHQLLHSRDLSGIGLPEHCSAFSPDHFRHLAGLPEPQLLPAPEAPFCFLHNRKCGGSTLRRLVKESAATKQLTTYIPCFGGVACETYDLSNMTTAVGGNVSVVAGHFSWEAIGELKGGANMS